MSGERGSSPAAGPAFRDQERSHPESVVAESVDAFLNRMETEGSLFGVTTALRVTARRETGQLGRGELSAVTGHYVRPPGFDAARRWLCDEHVVVLEGTAGTGKRAGAIALLREVADGPVIALSPMVSPHDLAEGDYRPGWGYLVAGHASPATEVESGSLWRSVRETVREAGAFLVVTVTPGVASIESVRRVAWRRPPLPEVLRACLGGAIDDDMVREATESGSADYVMTNVAEVARRIADGADPATAIQECDLAPDDRVRAWFDGNPSRRDVLDVTALAFFPGATERSFESRLSKLAAALEGTLPTGEASRDNGADKLPQGRTRCRSAHGLITVGRVSTGRGSRCAVLFKAPGYRRRVIAELWTRYPTDFWDAVKAWLDGLVATGDDLPVAAGLALLAEVSLDEVEDSYLDPWADGQLGPRGRKVAAYVLWMMCFGVSLAPEALRIADRWTGSGSEDQRHTAAIALSGELGVRFPVEAAGRLWRLVVAGVDDESFAMEALGRLFVTLVDTEGGDAVLSELDRALAAANDMWSRTLALKATLSVLSVPGRRCSLAALALLREQPAHTALVGRLWAAVVRSRAHRENALAALGRALAALPVSPASTRDVTALGRAIAEALPPVDIAALRQDLRCARNAASPMRDLLDALGEP
ncbi:hypothetical protein [Amycolatopsis pigmentata]|uniref:Uncharacterized protein n=1 Tax=Amycolatopsis pigmentata TaxID=450801 RepID=A0ABW5FRY9_9PSEU